MKEKWPMERVGDEGADLGVGSSLIHSLLAWFGRWNEEEMERRSREGIPFENEGRGELK